LLKPLSETIKFEKGFNENFGLRDSVSSLQQQFSSTLKKDHIKKNIELAAEINEYKNKFQSFKASVLSKNN
jgi:uncharacterized protein YlxW (UPF0749 family)